jgi:hypothetical protein
MRKKKEELERKEKQMQFCINVFLLLGFQGFFTLHIYTRILPLNFLPCDYLTNY